MLIGAYQDDGSIYILLQVNLANDLNFNNMLNQKKNLMLRLQLTRLKFWPNSGTTRGLFGCCYKIGLKSCRIHGLGHLFKLDRVSTKFHLAQILQEGKKKGPPQVFFFSACSAKTDLGWWVWTSSQKILVRWANRPDSYKIFSLILWEQQPNRP